MPRNGQGVYSLPPNTAAVSGQAVSSTKFNLLTGDLEDDANGVRPIAAGGTGADSVTGVRDILNVDQAASYATKSGSYTAVVADNNGTIRFSAAATLGLTSASTLGAGWHVAVIADGGDVTVDPSGSQLINDAATLTVPEGYSAALICDGSNFRTVFLAPAIQSAPASSGTRGHLSGLTLSNNGSDATNDIDVAVGTCMDSTNTYLMTLASSITKRLDAIWAVGTNQGGLDEGSPANTSYHVYLIKRLDTGVVDVLFSLPNPVPTLPTNYTIYRRIGSIIRAAGAIRGFSQFGDEFLLNTPVLDFDNTVGAGNTTTALTVPTTRVLAKLRVRGNNAVTWGILIYSIDVPAMTPGNTTAPGYTVGGSGGEPDRQTLDVRTNGIGQIRISVTDNGTELQIVTFGWIDTRGK